MLRNPYRQIANREVANSRHAGSAASRRKSQSSRLRYSPSVEILEDRLAPASFTPTTTLDLNISGIAVVNGQGQITNQGNAITLRSALIAANANGAASNTINLTTGGSWTLTSNDNLNPLAFGPTALVVGAFIHPP